MTLYSCDPALELTGATFLSFIENVNREITVPYLESRGVASIDDEAWYPVQMVLDIFNEMLADGESLTSFVAVGMAAAELSVNRPEVAQLTFEDFANLYGKIYQMRHRNGEAGEVTTTWLSDNHVAFIFDVPYPDNVMYGLIYGYARFFLSGDAEFIVYYDEDEPRREAGGERTIIHVEW